MERNPQYKVEKVVDTLIEKLPDVDGDTKAVPVTTAPPDTSLTSVLQTIQREVEQSLTRQVTQAEEALSVMLRQINGRLTQATAEVERLRQRLRDLEDQNEAYERKLTVLVDIKSKLSDI